jgi:hypothetical protein
VLHIIENVLTEITEAKATEVRDHEKIMART